MYRVIYYNTLPSSNTEADRLAAEGAEEGTVVICGEQTAGRGQRGNKWLTNAGENITMSLVLRPDIAAADLFLLSKAFSVAVVDCLRLFGVEARIKWPNDIYAENRKIAGILIEHSFRDNSPEYSIIGIGLNVKQTRFPPLSVTPTSIAAETGVVYELAPVTNSLLDCFLPLYRLLADNGKNEINKKYMKNLYRNTGVFPYIRPSGETFNAEIVDVADSGELILLSENGNKEAFRFKEVSAG